MRQYEKIWQEIKKLVGDEEIAVRTHISSKARLIQAVRLEKTKETAPRKKIGMFKRAGMLKVRVTPDTVKKDPDFIVIYFSLTWNGSQL